VLIFISLVVPDEALAYLDPGSGSYLIQIIVASLAGLGFLIKTNWGKIKNIFSQKTKKEIKNEKEDNLP